MSSLSYQHIYFIGIGGIGMSALARYFRLSGAKVYGYDKVETELTKQLIDEGMHVHYNEDISQIPAEIDLVVYTPAIPASHLELQYFKSNEYLLMKRAEVLGWISKDKKAIRNILKNQIKVYENYFGNNVEITYSYFSNEKTNKRTELINQIAKKIQ